MKLFKPLLLLAIFCLSIIASNAHAQSNSDKTITVLTKPIAPFVMKQDGKLVGFSIDLWREVAERGGLKSEFKYVDTLGELLEGIKTGKAQAAIAAITITQAREADLDFSHSYFHSGLQVLIANKGGNIASKVWSTIVSIITSSTFLVGIGLFLAFVFISGNLFWLAERKSNDQISPKYRHGVWDSFWWSLVTVSTVGYGDTVPRTQIGRWFSIFWIIFGYLGFAWFTAVITSTVTISQLSGSIDGPDALSGRAVATIEKSTSAKWLTNNVPGVALVPHKKIEDAYKDLVSGRVEAVVYDAPSLAYYASNEGLTKVRTAGSVFKKEEYGIAFPEGSPHREIVNQVLLDIFEDGTHAELMEKWFGVGEFR